MRALEERKNRKTERHGGGTKSKSETLLIQKPPLSLGFEAALDLIFCRMCEWLCAFFSLLFVVVVVGYSNELNAK